jgi:hypothetical protein
MASIVFVANPAQAALLNLDITNISGGGDVYNTGSAVFGTATSQWNNLSRGSSANNVALNDDTGTASGVTITYNRLNSGISISGGPSGVFANLGISRVQTANITFNGLVSNGNYQLAIFNGSTSTTSYTVNGNTQSITGSGDWSSLVQGTNYALFQTTANSSGQLSVSLPGTTSSNQSFSALQLQSDSASAVPEPLTILGAMTAAGFGAGFKRKLAKSKQDQEDA